MRVLPIYCSIPVRARQLHRRLTSKMASVTVILNNRMRPLGRPETLKTELRNRSMERKRESETRKRRKRRMLLTVSQRSHRSMKMTLSMMQIWRLWKASSMPDKTTSLIAAVIDLGQSQLIVGSRSRPPYVTKSKDLLLCKKS